MFIDITQILQRHACGNGVGDCVDRFWRSMETISVVSRDDELAENEAKSERITGEDRRKSRPTSAGESTGLRILCTTTLSW